MKYLAIDIGNTSIKVGFFQNTQLEAVKRFVSVQDVREATVAYADGPVIIASVVHDAQELDTLFGFFKQRLILTAATPIPIANMYRSKQTLGYDRLAAAVGANARFPGQNVLIIDIGTAIKYDFVSEQNEFIGGMIGPGRALRFKALHTFTQKLPLVEATHMTEWVGRDTEECIKSGVLNGMSAEINGVIAHYKATYNPVVLLCGGDALYFETQIKYPTFATPNLVLEGLIRILLYNVAEV